MMQAKEKTKTKRHRNKVFEQTYLISSQAGPLLSLTSRIPFPLKLFQMLEDVAHRGDSSLASWSDDGKSFQVHKADKFVEQIMPHYFRQTRYKSFQRQLHLYGFKRIMDGKDKGSYQHKNFVKADRDLCQKMEPLKKSRKTLQGKGQTNKDEVHKDKTNLGITRLIAATEESIEYFNPEDMVSTPIDQQAYSSFVAVGDERHECHPLAEKMLSCSSSSVEPIFLPPQVAHDSPECNQQINTSAFIKADPFALMEMRAPYPQGHVGLQAGHIVEGTNATHQQNEPGQFYGQRSTIVPNIPSANQDLWLNMLRAVAEVNESTLQVSSRVTGAMIFDQQHVAQRSSVLWQPSSATPTMMMEQMNAAGQRWLGQQQYYTASESSMTRIGAMGAEALLLEPSFVPPGVGPSPVALPAHNTELLHHREEQNGSAQRRAEGHKDNEELRHESTHYEGTPVVDFDYCDLEPRPI